MSKGNRQTKKLVDQHSRVAALIEDARKQGATSLNLSFQGLTELPESISQLSQLHTLSLDNNQLSALPEGVVAHK